MKRLIGLSLLVSLLLVACAPPGPPVGPTAIPALPSPTTQPTATIASPTATTAVTTTTAAPPANEVYLPAVAAQASSFDTSPGFAPSPDALNAADGDFETRWAPQNGLDKQWIYFDLGRQKTPDLVRIYWEDAYATAYELQLADDATNWRTVARLDGQNGGLDEVRFTAHPARYLRLLALARKFSAWGTSIWELEIYGPAAANPGDKPYAAVIAARPSPTAATLEPPAAVPGAWGNQMQAGVNYNSYREQEYLSPESDATLDYLKAGGVNAIAIVPTWYQQNLGADSIAPSPGRGGRTPSDAAIAHAINAAHRLGMRVLLKPHVDLRTTAARGAISNPSAAWFANYGTFIVHYARLAQTYKVELFAIGTELDGTLPGHEAEWRALIRQVRGLYSGPLTYAANWPRYADVPFWDDLDYIGIDGYWPVTQKIAPSDAELLQGWRAIAATLNRWRSAEKLTKPLILTELGYRAVAGANLQFAAPASDTPAPEQQAAVLRAALIAMHEQPWFRGIYYWNYLPAANISDPTGFTIRGKPAEQVLFNAYHEWAAGR